MIKRVGKITITEIARAAEVSSATVSLVLNGKGRISEGTRTKVNKAMQELGFIRDQGAANLRLGGSKLIGVVVNDISNPFFAELTAALEQTVSPSGFMLIVANSADDPARQRQLLLAMVGHSVAGLVVSPSAGTDHADFAFIKQREIPCVICVRELAGIGMDFVGADDFSAACLAVEHLFELGHRRIGFVGGVPSTTTWSFRQAGFRQAMHRLGAAVDEELILPGPTNRDFGRQVANRLLSQPEPLTAVVCFNDIVAIGLCAGLRVAGIDVGRQISVIGFDNLPESEAWPPPLTTVEVYPRGLGAETGRLLLRRLEGQSGAAVNQRLAPKLIVRQSTGAVAPANPLPAAD